MVIKDVHDLAITFHLQPYLTGPHFAPHLLAKPHLSLPRTLHAPAPGLASPHAVPSFCPLYLLKVKDISYALLEAFWGSFSSVYTLPRWRTFSLPFVPILYYKTYKNSFHFSSHSLEYHLLEERGCILIVLESLLVENWKKIFEFSLFVYLLLLEF